MNRTWMNEGDLEPEEASPRLVVDQLGALLGEIGQSRANVVHLIGDVMHSRSPASDEPTHRRVVAERREKLDAAVADANRRRLHTLSFHELAMFEPAAEQTLIRRHCRVEVLHRNADVVNSQRIHPPDVTVAPVLRRLLPALVVLSLVAAGCGGGSKSNGEATKTAAQVVADAKDAATAAKAVHVAGAITDAGQPLTLDITIVKGAGGMGTMSEAGLKFEIIRVGSKAYIKGSDAFLRKFAGATGAKLLHGKWLQGSATTGDLAALAPLTDITKLFNGALGSHGKLENGGETTFKGQKVVAIKDTTKGGTLYVAATGTPYPVAIVGGEDQGTITFDNWNDTVTIAAPKGAVDMNKLGAG
jgi:hypothetical protein